MTEDVVTRLRHSARFVHPADAKPLLAAADEIEQLRAQNKELQEALKQCFTISQRQFKALEAFTLACHITQTVAPVLKKCQEGSDG